jgi:hypothetical protein
MLGATLAVLVLAVAPPAVSATHTEKVDPFAAGWTIRSTDLGSCFSDSTSSKRPNAYRCYQGTNYVRDPCFSSPSSSATVRCVETPWSRKAEEVRLTKPLPAIGQGLELVWAVALANGARCFIWPDAPDVFYGHRVGWTCTKGEAAQGLHSGTTWWALWQPTSGVPWTHVAIRTLYR